MKFLAAAVAIAIALAWPTVGEAQSKKSKARKATTTQQQYVPRRAVAQTRVGTPCVGYTWRGCLGWDPDPLVRASILRDAGLDDY